MSYIDCVNIIWDTRKNTELIADRGVSFEEVAERILQEEYVAILENPAREEQYIFLIPMKGYIHVVPFVIDKDDNIVLKTIYPSRKFHKLYWRNHNEKNAR